MKAVMYHYVRNEDDRYPSFKFLHIQDFKKQLDYFSDNFTILHPDVLKESILAGKKAEGVILTFDDGVKDHYDFVMPELLKRGLSAIFYISTGVYENNKILGVHRLHLLLGQFGSEVIYHQLMGLVTNEMLSHAYVKEFQTVPYSLQNNDEYTNQVKRTMNYFISYKYREHILDQLMEDFFGGDKALLDSFYLSKSEIKDMHDAGMVIGSHTKTHPVLSKLSKAEQENEIKSSFNFLENICIKLPYKTFCYPYGGFHSFTDETEKILKEYECMFSFNVETRDISENDLKDRPQALPRYDCNYFPHGKLWENKRVLNEVK
ncbi:MAG: polysaccharide deacetylase [Segetibacter sp.]|nr:polysaccharide deacetylase [Segetibacter sp.]